MLHRLISLLLILPLLALASPGNVSPDQLKSMLRPLKPPAASAMKPGVPPPAPTPGVIPVPSGAPKPKPAPKPPAKPAPPKTGVDIGIGDIYVCQSKDFGGVCRLLKSVVNKCENLPYDLTGTLTSIKPYKNQMCRFFSQDNCYGDSDWMRWPGSKNMRGRRFDNKARSWQCTEDNCNSGADGGCSESGNGKPKKREL
ncbi:hypothetical protein NX059_008327 [Plenodomus lindquistii]|nr:hypothetical protein NX059_008327 [Plenodomus lindquistii]